MASDMDKAIIDIIDFDGDNILDKKSIIAMCIRNNFYIEDIYLHLFSDIYPPSKKRISQQCISMGSNLEEFLKIAKTKMLNKTITTLSIKLNNEILGFLIFSTMRDIKAIDLSFLFISETHRGNGYSHKLFNQLLVFYNISKSFRIINYLFVATEKEMIPFYKKLGFVEKNPTDYSHRNVENHTYLFYT
jgi:predicted GNAT family N-acyltransferase